MRQERTIQMSIFDLYAGHEIGRELKTMSQWLDEHPALVGLSVAVESLGGHPRAQPLRFDFYNRNKRSVALDLKKPVSIATVLKLVQNAGALIEGFRPGVMERLGLGPDVCRKANPSQRYLKFQDGGASRRVGYPRMVETRRVWRSE